MEPEAIVWSVRIGLDAEGDALAHARGTTLRIGVPVGFDAEDPRVTALETLLAALGADLVGGLRLAARRARVALDQVEALVWGELGNPLVCLGVRGETGDPGLARVVARIFVESPAGTSGVAPLLSEHLQRSAVYATLIKAARVEVDLVVT